jgi:hypothetical protein
MTSSGLEAQMVNVDFVEAGATSRTDFIVVRYSVTDSCVLSNIRVRFQGNGVKVSHCLYIDFLYLHQMSRSTFRILYCSFL